MPETTTEFIARVQAYCDAATEGPFGKRDDWADCEDGVLRPTGSIIVVDETRGLHVAKFIRQCDTQANVDFFTQSRTDLPRTLKALEYIHPFVHMSPERWGEFGRILNGQEVK